MEDYYCFHGNMAIFLYALETVVESQCSIAKVTKQTQLEPKTIANLLASDEAPAIDSAPSPTHRDVGSHRTVNRL